MIRFLIVVGVIFTLGSIASAQPKLELKPDKIEFEDLFNRLEPVYFINSGDETLTIDTVYYRSDLYHVRFDKYWHYPLILEPGDTIKMDCILAGYFNVSSADTVDTMYIASNSRDGIEEIKVKIDFFDDSDDASISGYITDGAYPLADAVVYFLFEGSYIIDTAMTDQNGFYSASLPEGRYTIAAVKDSFYTRFYDQKSDPFNAKIVTLTENSNPTINILLDKIVYTGNVVAGTIFDSLSITSLKKAIVVIRKGNHNPRKVSAVSLNTDDTYTVFVNQDGTFHADIIDQDHYYAQSFSDYYLPAYYKSENTSSVFWQQADSIFVSSYVPDINIFLPRDSSFGGGIIEGRIVDEGVNQDSLADILVFAQSVSNNFIYSYTFSKDDGEFKLTNLPYGQYKLFVQKIGYNDFYSDYIEINESIPMVKDVEIHVNLTGVDNDKIIPESIHLYQNYPNPFNPSTTIEFYLSSSSKIKLSISNILGEEIKTLYEGSLQKGNYSYLFNANNLSSGTYFVRLSNESKIIVRKILLLK